MNSPSASLVTIIRIHVLRVAAATIRGQGEIRYHHHYGVCKTIVVAAAATVYQEPHFQRVEGQKLFAFLFDPKNFLLESIAAHDLI